MSVMNLLYIGGEPLPQPEKYIGVTATMVDSGRNAQGVVIGSVIREDVAKVEAEWSYLSAQEWSNILMLFNSKYGGSFYNEVTFLNQVTNDWETRTMYVSDRTYSGTNLIDAATGKIRGYKGAKLSLIEV